MKDWIKTEDRLPERGQSVLTYPHFIVLPFGNTDEDLEHNWSDNNFWSFEGDGMIKEYPTHWMPLPEAPINK